MAFYEIGYAHAAGRPTVLLTQDISDVPVDLRHQQLVQYAQGQTDRARLMSALEKYLR